MSWPPKPYYFNKINAFLSARFGQNVHKLFNFANYMTKIREKSNTKSKKKHFFFFFFVEIDKYFLCVLWPPNHSNVLNVVVVAVVVAADMRIFLYPTLWVCVVFSWSHGLCRRVWSNDIFVTLVTCEVTLLL